MRRWPLFCEVEGMTRTTWGRAVGCWFDVGPVGLRMQVWTQLAVAPTVGCLVLAGSQPALGVAMCLEAVRERGLADREVLWHR